MLSLFGKVDSMVGLSYWPTIYRALALEPLESYLFIIHNYFLDNRADRPESKYHLQ